MDHLTFGMDHRRDGSPGMDHHHTFPIDELLRRLHHFPFLKTIDEFDFTFQSTLRLQMLGSCGFQKARARRRHRGKPRRWVVERSHSWFNRFRRILVRWEKRASSYIGMLHLVCGIIAWRATGLLG